jgi:hypothetical protein
MGNIAAAARGDDAHPGGGAACGGRLPRGAANAEPAISEQTRATESMSLDPAAPWRGGTLRSSGERWPRELAMMSILSFTMPSPRLSSVANVRPNAVSCGSAGAPVDAAGPHRAASLGTPTRCADESCCTPASSGRSRALLHRASGRSPGSAAQPGACRCSGYAFSRRIVPRRRIRSKRPHLPGDRADSLPSGSGMLGPDRQDLRLTRAARAAATPRWRRWRPGQRG